MASYQPFNHCAVSHLWFFYFIFHKITAKHYLWRTHLCKQQNDNELNCIIYFFHLENCTSGLKFKSKFTTAERVDGRSFWDILCAVVPLTAILRLLALKSYWEMGAKRVWTVMGSHFSASLEKRSLCLTSEVFKVGGHEGTAGGSGDFWSDTFVSKTTSTWIQHITNGWKEG